MIAKPSLELGIKVTSSRLRCEEQPLRCDTLSAEKYGPKVGSKSLVKTELMHACYNKVISKDFSNSSMQMTYISLILPFEMKINTSEL